MRESDIPTPVSTFVKNDGVRQTEDGPTSRNKSLMSVVTGSFIHLLLKIYQHWKKKASVVPMGHRNELQHEEYTNLALSVGGSFSLLSMAAGFTVELVPRVERQSY